MKLHFKLQGYVSEICFFVKSSFAKSMLVKKLYMFSKFSSLSACCNVNRFPRICLELLNLGHSRVMCLIVSFCRRVHRSDALLLCRLVKRECSTRVLVTITSSCLEEGNFNFHEFFFYIASIIDRGKLENLVPSLY